MSENDTHPTVTVERREVVRFAVITEQYSVGENDCSLTVTLSLDEARGLWNELGIALQEGE